MDNPPLLRAASLLGLSSALYTSAIFLTSSHLVLPILYRLPPATSTDIFQEFYHRGLATIVPLTIVSGLGNLTAAYLDARRRVGYAVAAGLVVAPLLWTVGVMMPTIQRLLEMAGGGGGQGEAVGLLRRWAWMNWVRCGVAGVGGVVGLLVYTGEV